MTDAEILAQLASAGRGGTCGRFRRGQLQRPLQPLAVAATTAWQTWLATLATVWGLREAATTPAAAQTPVEQQRPETQGPEDLLVRHRDNYEGLRQPIRQISGVVVDEETQDGLPGVTVLIENTAIGVATDTAGRFTLAIPADFPAGPLRLVFRYVGYFKEIKVLAWPATAPIQCKVALHVEVKGGIGYGVVPPLPWHPRQLYFWGKYWLARPFRSQ